MTRHTPTGHSGHTEWCAGGHHCALGEHRAQPIRIDIPGAGTTVLTRVLAADGAQHAEVTLSVTLPRAESMARLRLVALLTHLETLIGPRSPSSTRTGAAASSPPSSPPATGAPSAPDRDS